MRSVCVFCGSNPGDRPAFVELARTLGTLLARRGTTLVYGGGRVGLMGAAADAALAAGGRVIGVIPQMLLDREVGHSGLTQLHVVGTMAERKRLMGELADAFITLPGGIGTMDELFEAWTWTQLRLHDKPCGLLNFAGYYDALIAFLDGAVEAGFLRPRHRAALIVDTNLESLLARLADAAGRPAPVASPAAE
ncbi:MAG: TIGR00730 family Rossman fold protein [Proteobacteria bacterium]|nr:MAG: TIGR00730 family Rossman fold protein [Pseudomonadota bacterium]